MIPVIPGGVLAVVVATATMAPGANTDAALAPATSEPTAKPSARTHGVASWFAAPAGTAAAGPALRRLLGKDWRGQHVRVSAGGRSVVVALTDWCQCYRGEDRERIIDLSRGAFAALADPSRGVLRVTISE